MKNKCLLLIVWILIITACQKKSEPIPAPKEISIISGNYQKGFPYSYLIDTILIRVVPENKNDMLKYSYSLTTLDFDSKASYIMSYDSNGDLIFKVLWKLSGENNLQELTFGIYTDPGQSIPAKSVTLTATFKKPWQTICHDVNTMQDIHFTDAYNGLIAGDFNGVYSTHDGGVTWSFISVYGFSSYNLTFCSRDTGLAVSQFNKARFTSDGGQTFISSDWISPKTTYRLNDYLMLDHNKVLGVGPEGNIFKTVDAGKTWKKCEGYTFYDYLYTVIATNNKTVYTCGQKGEVLKSSDMGETWQVQITNTSEDLKTIYFYDNDFGLAGGKMGTLIRTTDGGTNWQVVRSGLTFDIVGVYFATPKTGFVVSYAGEIARTKDGGLTWKLECTDSYNAYDLTKVWFNDSLSVFGIESGRVERYNMQN